MASNSFGTFFKMTTWGESHGKAIGVVLDGVPPGIPLTEEDIQVDLDRRRPGQTPWTSPRFEPDQAEILSGTFEGMTTGTPISILIRNQNHDSKPYHQVAKLHKPGHASYAYIEKYGIFDYRGGGRASARETACRVAAGAVAKKILAQKEIFIKGFLSEVGPCRLEERYFDSLQDLEERLSKSSIFVPSAQTESAICSYLEGLMREGDSSGGIIEAIAFGMPAGLGDPVYEKLEAKLAHAMLSLPASKGFEIGEGMRAASMRGSDHNDGMFVEESQVAFATNHSGGTLGGISTGQPLQFRVAFKPTSSIRKDQNTVTYDGKEAVFSLPVGSRHDPCVAIRAVPIVEAMGALVLVDSLLMQKALEEFSPRGVYI